MRRSNVSTRPIRPAYENRPAALSSPAEDRGSKEGHVHLPKISCTRGRPEEPNILEGLGVAGKCFHASLCVFLASRDFAIGVKTGGCLARQFWVRASVRCDGRGSLGSDIGFVDALSVSQAGHLDGSCFCQWLMSVCSDNRNTWHQQNSLPVTGVIAPCPRKTSHLARQHNSTSSTPTRANETSSAQQPQQRPQIPRGPEAASHGTSCPPRKNAPRRSAL